MENFKYAYDHQDTLVYGDCLDEGYIYEWFNEETRLPEEWTKKEDVEATKRLFDYFTRITLTWVDSPDPEIEEKNQQHPTETWIVYRQNYDLLVLRGDPPTGYQATGQQLMKFRRDDRRGRWFLVYWEDLEL